MVFPLSLCVISVIFLEEVIRDWPIGWSSSTIAESQVKVIRETVIVISFKVVHLLQCEKGIIWFPQSKLKLI